MGRATLARCCTTEPGYCQAMVSGEDEGDVKLRTRLRGVGTLALGHAMNDSYAYVLQAVLPALIGSLGLTLGMAGGLVSVYQLTSSVIQPAVGYFADRTTLRWPAWAGIAMSSVAAGLLGLAPSYFALLGLLMIGGVGSSIFHPVSAAMAGAAAPAQSRGRWLGLYVSAGNFGLSIGPLMIAALLASRGPQDTWPIMLPGLLVAVIVAVLAPHGRVPTQRGGSLSLTLHRYGHVLVGLIMVTALRAWASNALTTFIPLLGAERGASLDQSAVALTAFLFSGAVGGVIGGFASDRLGRDRTIIGSLILSVPCGVYAALVPSIGLDFVVASAATGFLLNGSFVVLTVRGQESVPGRVGMVTGLILGLSVGVGGVAVTPLALLAERVGLPASTALAACLGGLAALAMRLVPQRVPE
jgi:FSR family fosmidomycin resistance protein-like MFS transporter